MPYHITEYSKQQAKKLNVDVKPSSKKNKKIDVIKNDKVIASIGDMKYINNDYPNYLKSHGKEYADLRRKLYKIRHKNDLKIKNTPGYWASRLLW